MTLEETFLRKKPVQILLVLFRSKDPLYISKVSKKANCTYSHTINIISLFQEQELIEFEREGRRKFVLLTERGFCIAEKLNSFVREIS